MMTTTHVLVSCGLLTQPHNRARNWAAVLGGLLPDVPMAVLYAYDRLFQGIPEAVIWGERYSSDTWQIPIAISHSIPIYAFVLAMGLLLRSEVIKIYAASTFLHILCDLPVHHDDAHMHFWPLSHWKFISPVSYWDSAHHGAAMSAIELLVTSMMLGLLWRRFESRWVRASLVATLALFVVVPLYFSLMHHGG